MAKSHDERKDVRLLSRICKVTNDKTIRVNKNSIIGINAWGKIDYLTKYCGYVLIWDNGVVSGANGDVSDSSEDTKKNKKKTIRKETKNNYKKK